MVKNKATTYKFLKNYEENLSPYFPKDLIGLVNEYLLNSNSRIDLLKDIENLKKYEINSEKFVRLRLNWSMEKLSLLRGYITASGFSYYNVLDNEISKNIKSSFYAYKYTYYSMLSHTQLMHLNENRFRRLIEERGWIISTYEYLGD